MLTRLKQRRYHHRATVCLALAACFPLAQLAQAALLPEVITTAVREHPDVTAAEASLRASDSVISQARSDFYPGLSGSYSAADTSQRQAGVSQQGTPRYGEGVLRWNLFRGQRDIYGLSSATRQREAAAAELSEAQERVALQIAEVYAEVARLRLALIAAQAYVQEFQSLENLVSARVAQGRAASADLTQIRVNLIEARLQVATIQGQLRGAEHRYRTAVGAEPGQVVAPALRWVEQPLEPLIQAIDEGNPRVRASRERAAARTEEVGVARSTLYPSVDLEFRKRFAQQNTLRSTIELERSSQVGVSLEIPLGGRNFARVKEARAREQQAMAQIESDRMAVRSSYGDIVRQLMEMRAIAPQLEQRVDASAELVRAYALQFEAGRRTIIELVNAQRERFNAQMALLDNVTQQFTYHARLLNLGGQLNTELQRRYHDAPIPTAAPLAVFQPGKSIVGNYVADHSAAKPPRAEVSAENDAAPRDTALVATGQPQGVAAALKPGASNADRDTVLTQVQAWAQAWSDKDYARYRAFYAEDFRGDGFRNTPEWEATRRMRLNKPGAVSVALDALNARPLSAAEVMVDFVQRYTSADFSGLARKQLLWRHTEGGWKITRENVGAQ